jgi:hypothetical protein
LAVVGLTIGVGLALASTAFAQLATTNLTTVASGGFVIGQPGPLTNGNANDVATLSGATQQAAGSITFSAYGPNNPTCQGAPVFTSNAVPVTGPGNYTSAPVFHPTTAGTYLWTASYTGDNVANNPSSSPCGAANETLVVSPEDPTITTDASDDIPLGDAMSDSATLSGGFAPTGVLQFRAYGPDDPDCTHASKLDVQVQVTGNGLYTSGDVFPTEAGTYYWVAEYFGDANNLPFETACHVYQERVVVDSLVTEASPNIVLGGRISDKATLVGRNPTGEIYWELYGPDDADCSRVPIFFITGVPVSFGNGTYFSEEYVPLVPGTYRWIARYTGDGNHNVPFSTKCNDPNETVTVSPVPIVVVPAHSTSHRRAVVKYARYVAPKGKRAGYLLVRVNSKAKRVRLRIRMGKKSVTRSVLTNRAVRLRGLSVAGVKTIRVIPLS